MPRVAKSNGQTRPPKLTYKASGVDVSANDEMVERIKGALTRTYDDRVISRHNAFAGLFRLDYGGELLKRRYRDPVLVSGTDGVGSKLLLGAQLDRIDGLGTDLVAMNVNDVLTTGAEPLFFLDYIACNKLSPAWITRMVESIAQGCELADCSLLGGETAELPDLYAPGHFDLAGFCVGVAERNRLLDGPRNVRPGDVVLGLASSGVHSNGYALVRKSLERLPKNGELPVELGEPLADAVMRPTRIYVKPVVALLKKYRRKRAVRAMAHITGGGLGGNIPRVIPDNCDIVLKRGSWPIPPIFKLIQACGVAESEMYRVFNMGIGFVLIVRPAFVDSIMRHLKRMDEPVHRIGVVRRGTNKLTWK